MMTIQTSLNVHGFNPQELSESFLSTSLPSLCFLIHLKPETQNDADLKIALSAWFVKCANSFQEAGKTKRNRGVKG